MPSTYATAAAGMQRANAKLTSAASAITAVQPIQDTATFSEAAVQMSQAKTQSKAMVALINAEQAMTRATLDMMA